MPALHTLRASRVSQSLNVCRHNVESSGFNFWRSFNHKPWQWKSRSFFVSCDFRQQFLSQCLPRSATQTFPVRRFSSIAWCVAKFNYVPSKLRPDAALPSDTPTSASKTCPSSQLGNEKMGHWCASVNLTSCGWNNASAQRKCDSIEVWWSDHLDLHCGWS